MNVDVTRLRNSQSPQLPRTMNVDMVRFGNHQLPELGEFVPFIEVGGWDSYRIGSTVFGTVNITSRGGFSNCAVEFQVMASNGTAIHQESLNSSLEANVETPIFFTWSSGELPLGDYYARMIVRDELSLLVYDTSWFYAFTVTEPIFVYDFGSLHDYHYKTYSPSSPQTFNRGEQAVFNFSLSVGIGCLKIRVEGSNNSDFLLEIGNDPVKAVADVYLRNGSHYLTFYNIPKGNYRMIFNVASPSAKITELSLETLYKAIPFLWHELRDEVSAIDKITSLTDTERMFSLIATYISNRTEPLELTITESTGDQIVQLTGNTTLLQENREVYFFFNLTFPSDPVTTDLTFNLTLVDSGYSKTWTALFEARKCPYTIDLQASGPVETRYYKVDGGLSLFQKSMRRVGKDEVEALAVTDVKIVDLGVNETDETEPLKNVTVRFTVENQYVKSTPWGWSYYTYYDLYVYPVIGPNGTHINQPRGLVLYKEVEQVLVKGVPVTYQDNGPRVHISIRFVKSHWPNFIDWIFRRAITMLPIPAYPSGTIAKLAMWAVDYFVDKQLGQSSKDNLINIIETGIHGEGLIWLKALLQEVFGTEDLDTILQFLPVWSLCMFIWDQAMFRGEPQIGLKILRGMTVSGLKVLWRKPWVMRRILDQAWQKVLDKKFPDTVPYKALSKAAQQMLFIAAAAEAIVDFIMDVLAPAKEIKEILWSDIDPPETGNFTNIPLGDPLLTVNFSGSINKSTFFSTGLYSIEHLQLNITNGTNETAIFHLTITPHTNYTGIWKSLVYDDIGRSQLIINSGIFPKHSTFHQENESIIIEGTGIPSSQHQKLFINVENGVMTGSMQQPFQAPITNNTGHVDLSMVYPFGTNLTYTVQVVLPPNSTNIEVLSDGNYTIQDNIVIWNMPIERIEVKFTIPSNTEAHFTLSPNPATSNDLITLLGNLTEADTGKLINNTKVDLYVNGTLRSSLWTNASGWFKGSGYASPGVYIINVTYPGSDIYLPSSHNQTLYVFTKIPTKTWFTLSPNPANASQTITLTGNLTDKFNNSLVSAPIEIYYSADNGTTWTYAGTLTTNSTGWFKASGTIRQPGTYKIATLYRGSNRYGLSYHIEILTVTVASTQENPSEMSSLGQQLQLSQLILSLSALAYLSSGRMQILSSKAKSFFTTRFRRPFTGKTMYKQATRTRKVVN